MRYFLATAAAGALSLATIATAFAHPMLKAPQIVTDNDRSVIRISSDNTAQDHMAEAAPATLGDLEISSGWVRAMLPGQKAGGGYMTITNNGTTADRLIGVASPAAGKTEVHTMEIVNDVMTMRPVEGGLEIPAGGSVELKPGGYHIMFMSVSEPFAEETSVPLRLEFETAGAVEIILPVHSVKGQSDEHGHKQH